MAACYCLACMSIVSHCVLANVVRIAAVQAPVNWVLFTLVTRAHCSLNTSIHHESRTSVH